MERAVLRFWAGASERDSRTIDMTRAEVRMIFPLTARECCTLELHHVNTPGFGDDICDLRFCAWAATVYFVCRLCGVERAPDSVSHLRQHLLRRPPWLELDLDHVGRRGRAHRWRPS